jgi:hypothetical protein
LPLPSVISTYGVCFENDYSTTLFIEESEKCNFQYYKSIGLNIENFNANDFIKKLGFTRLLFSWSSSQVNELYFGSEILLAKNDNIISRINASALSSSKVVSVTLKLSSSSENKLEEIVEIIKKLHFERKTEDNKISVSFTSIGKSGTYQTYNRQIEAPSFNEIVGNYNGDTLKSIIKLKDGNMEHSGKLLLFHGEPGTGKTYMIRALARHLKEKCDFFYILDPEQLFNNMSYMTSLILEDGKNEVENPNGITHTNCEAKYKFIILEDADEFITEDAKSRTGQALSRLLNISDGFIGQGLKIIFLVTTNEPLNKVNRALSREGRCGAIIKFNKLSKEESIKWLDKREIKNQVSKDMTIADLYSMINEKRIGTNEMKEKKVGF